MQVRDVFNLFMKLPGFDMWPEVQDLFPDQESFVRMDWRLPVYSIEAVDLERPDPLPLVSALACLQVSIILVDDILDEDARGKHNEMGTGRAANLALALQSASHLLVQDMALPAERLNRLTTSLQKMAYRTAVGQEIDVNEIANEADYWALVQAKSTPFYGTALEIGAITAGASPQMCQAIYEVGSVFGEIIQIMDDITDAFEQPAKPDWIRQNNNLVILFAKTALHTRQGQFHTYLSDIATPESLAKAQSLLIESGAVSYGIYHIFDRYHRAQAILREAGVPHDITITGLLKQQIKPLLSLLSKINVDVPADYL